ncbi:MAG: hypothetical protein AAF488_11705 [Planctomycetota bacterium]
MSDSVQVKFQFRGWMVIPALIAIAIFFGYKHHSLQTALGDELQVRIRNEIVSEYTRARLPGMKDALGSGNKAHASTLAGEMIKPEDVELVAPSIKGVHGKRQLVRVGIRVRGAAPTTGKAVRYYEVERVLGDWRIVRERGKFSWYTKLF